MRALIDHLAHDLGGGDPALRATARDGSAPEDPFAAADGGELRSLTASFAEFDLNYTSPSPDYHTLQARLPGLVSAPGAERVLDPRGSLLEAIGPGLGAYYAFLAAVPRDPQAPEIRELGIWPPKGHYADYLSPALTKQCGGAEQLATELANHDVTALADGALLVGLPLAPSEATTPRARELRAAFGAAVEECAA
jgi:hypothetical protein